MRKKDIIGIILLIMAGILTGGHLAKQSGKGEKVTMAGSVAMETFAEAITEQAEKIGVETKAEYIGSSAGIEALLKGKTQIALVSRNLTEEEKRQGVKEYIAAYDGIVVIVNKENPITNLSITQLKEIFTGKKTNWNEFGELDEPIVVIGRECGSGTRDSFERLLGIEGKTRYCNECDSIGVVKVKVGLIKGAIGYVSLEAVKDRVQKTKEEKVNIEGKKDFFESQSDLVKTICVENVKPSIKSYVAGEYFLVRPFILATRGEWNKQSEEVKKIYYLLESKEGDIIFERAGIAAASKKRAS